MGLKKTRKSHNPAFPVIILFMLPCAVFCAEPADTTGPVPPPPFANGGLTSLGVMEHRFIEKHYGPYELLDFRNAPYAPARGVDGWHLVTMGTFVPGRGTIQFAAPVRLTGSREGLVLVVFGWHPGRDTATTYGMINHAFFSRKRMLIATVQGEEVDTLAFTCEDLSRTCGKYYYDVDTGEFVLKVEAKE